LHGRCSVFVSTPDTLSLLKKSTHLPVAILAIALLTATVIAVGGWHLAGEQTVQRLGRDRAALNDFSDELQDELRRLEKRYTGHLSALADAATDQAVSNLELRERAQAVWGVRQVSVLRHAGRAKFHLSIEADSEIVLAELPVVEFPQGQPPPARPVWWIDPLVVGSDAGANSGWIKDRARGGKSSSEGLLLYWQAIGESGVDADDDVVVILVEESQVAAPMQTWLKDWHPAKFDEVLNAGGPDQVRGPIGVLAVAGDIPASSPDQVQSLRMRFGDWQVQSWDPRRTVVVRDERVVKIALAVAVLVSVVGAGAFYALRHALLLAAQRVSFVNQVSHELRTPLTNILLNTELAAEEASAPARRRLDLVRDEAGRLKRLIDNVLTFSKLRSEMTGRALKGYCDLSAVVSELLEQFASSLKRRGLAVDWSAGDELLNAAADEDAVAQIVGNLISNAEKYAYSGRVLKLEAYREASEVVLQVADRGPGIANSQREVIFETFHRLDDRVTEGSSGTGLGLSIARSLAEKHGGSLQLLYAGVSSEGATFELRLPLAAGERVTVVDFPKSQAS